MCECAPITSSETSCSVSKQTIELYRNYTNGLPSRFLCSRRISIVEKFKEFVFFGSSPVYWNPKVMFNLMMTTNLLLALREQNVFERWTKLCCVYLPNLRSAYWICRFVCSIWVEILDKMCRISHKKSRDKSCCIFRRKKLLAVPSWIGNVKTEYY